MIKTLKNSLANVLLALSKTNNKLDRKVISLVNTIDKAINTFISRIEFCPRLVLGFDKEYKSTQIRV